MHWKTYYFQLLHHEIPTHKPDKTYHTRKLSVIFLFNLGTLLFILLLYPTKSKKDSIAFNPRIKCLKTPLKTP